MARAISSSVGPGGGRLRAPAKQSIEEFALSGKGYVAHRMGFTLCNSPLGGILFTVTPGRIWSFSIKSEPSGCRWQAAKCTCRPMDGPKQVTITSSQMHRVKITHLLLLFASTSAVFFSQQQTAGACIVFTACCTRSSVRIVHFLQNGATGAYYRLLSVRTCVNTHKTIRYHTTGHHTTRNSHLKPLPVQHDIIARRHRSHCWSAGRRRGRAPRSPQ